MKRWIVIQIINEVCIEVGRFDTKEEAVMHSALIANSYVDDQAMIDAFHDDQQEQLCSCCGKPVNDWCDDTGMCIACHHGD
jgi:Zn finger protein HypA/HybF involved in hydrogenase expression